MRLGIIGFGAQAREKLVPCCRALPGVEIAAVCDIEERARAQARQTLGIEAVYDDHRAMMEGGGLDAVVAACYPAEHYEIAVDALTRRLPVFVEKPPAPSTANLKSMIDLARDTGTTTGVGMNFRYAGVTRRLKAMAEGEINTIVLRHFANKPTQPLWDQSSTLKSFLYAQVIHSVDFLVDLCGPINEISVVNGGFEHKVVLTIVLTFAEGSSATLVTSNTSPHFVFEFDAICMGRRHVSAEAMWRVNVTETGKAYAGNEYKRWSESWAHSPLDSGFERAGYAGQMAEFLSAVREGRESDLSFASLAETYRCLDEIESQASADRQPFVQLAS